MATNSYKLTPNISASMIWNLLLTAEILRFLWIFGKKNFEVAFGFLGKKWALVFWGVVTNIFKSSKWGIFFRKAGYRLLPANILCI